MLLSQIRVALRNLTKHRGYSFITITGLTVGICASLLIFMWVATQFSYDRFHSKSDRIYRLALSADFAGREITGPLSNLPTGPALVSEMPEVVKAVRFQVLEDIVLKSGERVFRNGRVFYSDNEIFEIFDFPLVQGDPESALTAANAIVVTESTARRYFGDADPIGRPMVMEGETEFTVTGVARDVPANSHIQFDALCSFATVAANDPKVMEEWIEFGYYTYLLLADPEAAGSLEAKLGGFVDRHLGVWMTEMGGNMDFFLQPLASIHLNPNLLFEMNPGPSLAQVYTFASVAILVLLIACINYINLTTARATVRVREVGMRRTLGAGRMSLLSQFLLESMTVAVVATLLATLLTELALPYFNWIAGSDLDSGVLLSPEWLAGLVGMALLVGFIAGFYPALVLSSMSPSRVTRRESTSGGVSGWLRTVMVVTQFSLSLVLIVGAIVIQRQMTFLQNVELGFTQDQVLVMRDVGDVLGEKVRALANEIGDLPGVASVTIGTSAPGRVSSNWVFRPEGYAESETVLAAALGIDDDYLATLDMKLVAGRNFFRERPSDTAESAIVNQAAVRKFGWDQPLGKKIETRVPGDSGWVWVSRTIVGVLEDFHFESLHNTIEPLFIYNAYDGDDICVRLTGVDIAQTVGRIESVWNSHAPDMPFESFFLDEWFDSLYHREGRLNRVSVAFSVLSWFIACLGLLGIAIHTAERRSKEMAVRKILGCSVPSALLLLARESLVTVGLACLIGWPVAYWVANRWLSDFAYRTTLDLSIFAAAGTALLLVALVTISYQVLRVARANPTEALRNE